MERRADVPLRRGDENHLRRIVSQRRTVEISIERLHVKATARQQMLDFIAEEIAQRPRHDQPFVFAAGMTNAEDHLDIISLQPAMKRRDAFRDADMSAV